MLRIRVKQKQKLKKFLQSIEKSKISNTIEITKKYLRESKHFTPSQRQLFNDFIHTLEVYKSKEYLSNNDNRYTHYDNKFNFPGEDDIDSESNYLPAIEGGVFTIDAPHFANAIETLDLF